MAIPDVPRHEGGSFEPVPRAPEDTARPYPPEAAPVSREPDVEPAQVTGDATAPLPREQHTDSTAPEVDVEPRPAEEQGQDASGQGASEPGSESTAPTPEPPD